MNRCIELAKNGLGTTYPNPMVGCVLVFEDKIIGEGWHQKAGLPHAEVVAIKSVKNPELLSKATLYVTLEPCSHYGKTPPCSDLIIEQGIPKVVIGSKDPNPLVAGKGIQKLREAGVNVEEGVMRQDCERLNKRFFTYHRKKRPYIFLKWAETRDGFIAPLNKTVKKPVWITNALSRQWVHKLRAQEGAILIGATTLQEDSPSLTTRDWYGSNPLRIILSQHPLSVKDIPLANEVPTVLFQSEDGSSTEMLEYIKYDSSRPLGIQVCEYLFKAEIQSLIVEGGRETLQGFIDENLWDEVLVFKGKGSFTEGVLSPRFHGTPVKSISFGEDTLLNYKNPED